MGAESNFIWSVLGPSFYVVARMLASVQRFRVWSGFAVLLGAAALACGGEEPGVTATGGSRAPSLSGGSGGTAGSSVAAGRGGRPAATAGVAGGAFAATGAGRAGTIGGSGSGGTSGSGALGSTNMNAGAPSAPVGGAGGRSGASANGTKAPYKGVANSPCAARSALQVSWYYNWMQTEAEPCSDGRGGEFVPMIWGHTGAEQTLSGIETAVTGLIKNGYHTVLGFNEPDNSTQSNMSVDKAISLWPALDQGDIRIGTPGTQANATPGQAWFKDFISQLQADPKRRADFLAIHWYGWNAGSCDAQASQLESYIRWAEGLPGQRPIWITEWGCLNQSAGDDATVNTFFKAAVAMFAKHPRIERYAWYPWSSHCGLVNSDGSLTQLGKTFAAMPAEKQ
jgi:Glycosyl hydrolase catalytic core